jgi:hypothetical protein
VVPRTARRSSAPPRATTARARCRRSRTRTTNAASWCGHQSLFLSRRSKLEDQLQRRLAFRVSQSRLSGQIGVPGSSPATKRV